MNKDAIRRKGTIYECGHVVEYEFDMSKLDDLSSFLADNDFFIQLQDAASKDAYEGISQDDVTSRNFSGDYIDRNGITTEIEGCWKIVPPESEEEEKGKVQKLIE